MGAFPRMAFALWLFLIFSFCVYGFAETHSRPGETFGCFMYMALTFLSGLCMFQVIEPIRERAWTDN